MAAINYEEFAKVVSDAMERRLAPIREELKALQEGEVVARAYKGLYDPETEYARGNLLTEAGSLWLCVHPTKGRPGKSADWRLVIKGGPGR